MMVTMPAKAKTRPNRAAKVAELFGHGWSRSLAKARAEGMTDDETTRLEGLHGLSDRTLSRRYDAMASDVARKLAELEPLPKPPRGRPRGELTPASKLALVEEAKVILRGFYAPLVAKLLRERRCPPEELAAQQERWLAAVVTDSFVVESFFAGLVKIERDGNKVTIYVNEAPTLADLGRLRTSATGLPVALRRKIKSTLSDVSAARTDPN